MIFESLDLYIDLVEKQELQDLVEVYNSNKCFLMNHMETDRVTHEWMLEELEVMKKADFWSCKVVEKGSEKIIGVIDLKMGEEAYLSLLMLHSDYKFKGLGNQVYLAFEEYVSRQKGKCIRIDVVTSYDETVLNFWIRNGFTKVKDIELNWTGKVLPAAMMRKSLD